MAESEKDRLAHAVVERHRDFSLALEGDRRSYPTREFRAFAEAIQRYVRAIQGAELIHRGVVEAVHCLVDYLRVERKKVPNGVLVDAERLESFLFLGYDPFFEGEEPPGL